MRAINFRPDKAWSLALAFLPFLFLCLAYVVGSEIQLAENPQDKLLPDFSTMGEALDAYAMKPDTRTGQFLLWSDTAGSMTRLLTGLAISTSLALVVGIVVGLLPVARSAFAPAISVLSSTTQIGLRVVLPQILPRLIDSVRLEIGPAWLFLIAAEAIAADSGLGYRIFLVRRYLSMDVIIPYVAWITLLAFMMDLALRVLQRKAFPWFAEARAA